jgi:hypothetical protein
VYRCQAPPRAPGAEPEPRPKRAHLRRLNIVRETGMLQGPGGRPMTRRDILELIGTTTIAGSPARRWRNRQARRPLKLSASFLGKRRPPLFAEQALDVSISAAEMNEALASGSMHITATGDVPTIGLMAHKGPAIMSRPADRFLLRSRHGRAQGHNRAEADRALSRSVVWMTKRSGSFT